MQNTRLKKIIMGIDPGVASVGYGVIELQIAKGKSQRAKLSVTDFGVIKTKASLPFIERLKIIHQELEKLIKKYKPTKIAVEEIFFAKNTKTAIKVGEARGVILYTIIEAGQKSTSKGIEQKILFYEFTPLEVKQAITGYGQASKEQMQKMVKILLNLKKIPKPDDAADALAVAITCVQTNQFIQHLPE